MLLSCFQYMNDVLKYNIKENGFYSSMPYIAMWICTMIFSVISDWCIKKDYIGVTNSRKLYTTLSFTVTGVFLVLASFGGCNRVVTVTLFTVAMGFMGAYCKFSQNCLAHFAEFLNVGIQEFHTCRSLDENEIILIYLNSHSYQTRE